MNIRLIIKSDKEKYVEMCKKMYSTNAVLHNVNENNFYKSFDLFFLDSRYFDIYVLEYEKELIGYFNLSKTYSQEVCGMVLLIEEIFIEENFRNRGFAKAIFKFINENYKEYKRYKLEVTKVNDAISLYYKLGFKKNDYLQMYKDF